jgi:nitroreductase
MSLGEALKKRHSTRSFDKDKAPNLSQLATVLWAAAGITRPDAEHPQGGKRTAPSAYGSAAIDILVTSRDGTFLYVPPRHTLVRRSTKDLRKPLAGPDWAAEAPLLLIMVANYDRYPESVREERRRDYGYADAGTAGENVYLAATALGMGTVLTVCSHPESAALLGLRENQRALFVFPLGFEK